MESEIKRWGNSAAVRLNSKILAQANLDVSSPINIEVKAGQIIIEGTMPEVKLIKFPFSEEQLLKGLDPYTSHADELASPSAKESGD
jgi:antitoxin MazE